MTTQKHFSPAFKLEIAKLMVEEQYSIKQACEASGAGETAVKRWKQQYLAEKAGNPLPNKSALTEEQREIQPNRH
ncbi:transposase [Candidatus Thiothrix anitrata]|uniref:Transposase n=1 Tax=Candidatus Thiothrix anitrata TaxID=2823902 RepID=A0ABX7X1K2_9GAMM|nr:transposase [Candidatus Thiothrix anitrata]QTR48518.1 transposase [Candidatus Thiothrix anitrata]